MDLARWRDGEMGRDTLKPFSRNRRVDLLVNPPLTIYFITESYAVTKNSWFLMNDEDVVLPNKKKGML